MAFDLEKMRAMKLKGHDNILSHVWGGGLGWGKNNLLNATYGLLVAYLLYAV